MSVSSEWNSLKATWLLLLLVLAVRIFLSAQFLLSPEEAVYWYTSKSPHGPPQAMKWLIQVSTAVFGDNETAVRLPALLAVTLASFFMALLTANMFSWHTAFHVTLLSQGILQLNMAALILSPYSLLLPCWAAVCYYSSQAMHSNRIDEWLLAGFWFGVGLLFSMAMLLLLPSFALCLILIKSFRTSLYYPGPWLALLLSICIFLVTGYFWHGGFDLSPPSQQLANIKSISSFFLPDASYSLRFLLDQAILLTPVVFLMILFGWLTGAGTRHLVKPDAQFLILTSFPLFLLYLVFPFFGLAGTNMPVFLFITPLALIAGLHSSTKSNFKGRPKRRWILGIITAHLVTIPLLAEFTYPSFSLQINIPQTRFITSGWDLLGQEIVQSADRMPDKENTFIFSMDEQVASELAFYTPGDVPVLSLERLPQSQNAKYPENKLQLPGRDGIGVFSSSTALDQVKPLFEKVELEREFTLHTTASGEKDQARTFFIVRGFNFKNPGP